MKPIVVYDCMLFLRAAARPSRTYGTFRLVDDGLVTLCLSAEVVAEIRDVLNRPAHRAKFPALDPKVVDSFLNHYLRMAQWFDDVPAVFDLVRDPKDSKYLNLAIASKADFLVSADHDLLDLKKDQAQFGFRILDPAGFVDILRRELSIQSLP